MSPVKGQSVKSALQYNSQMRNMSDVQFMRHLGWLDTGSSREKRHGYSTQGSSSYETSNTGMGGAASTA